MAKWLRDKLQSWMDANSPAARAGNAPSAIHVTAFGKHPGWDDHIDDIPLPTQALVDFQRLLYLQGIGQNIETGRWQNAPQEHVLPWFDHWVFWSQHPREFIAARLWSSVDGKGRASYPLIVATQINEAASAARLDAAIEALSALEIRARASSLATEVRDFVVDAQNDLRAALSATANTAMPPPVPGADPLTHIDACVTRDGLHRLMYESARAGGAAWIGTGDAAHQAAITLRIKRCSDSVSQDITMWIAFVSRLLKPRPMLIVVGEAANTSEHEANPERWVDVICGEPTSAEMACLRSTAALLPPTASIPYTIDEAFSRDADAALARAMTATSAR